MVLEAIAALSLLSWVVLLLGRGQFWRGAIVLEQLPERFLGQFPSPFLRQSAAAASVTAIVPARNEAEVLPTALRSLLSQRYSGVLRVVLVDDGSTDGTGALAQELAASLPWVQLVSLDRPNSDEAAAGTILFAITSPPPLPQGWTGKLWALRHGIAAARSRWGDPDYVWLTDADIAHPPDNAQRLVALALGDRRELVSLMVRLRCHSRWERLLVPAFIFFFQKLYPFPWVNDPQRETAAAAGGCILLETAALDRIGGIDAICEALIDDCALAWAVKHAHHAGTNGRDRPQTKPPRRIWLGLSTATHSLRPYDSLASLWEMVARTAYTQLNYSPLLLVGTIAGMVLVYLMPPIAAIMGIARGLPTLTLLAGLTWAGMVIAYRPTLRFYGQPGVQGLALPIVASIYLLATLDSAWRHWRGRGGAWKGRTYSGS